MRVVLLGLLVFLSGCAHTLVIDRGAPPERYREAQEFLHSGKPASLFLHTGTKLRATDLHIGPDSTVFRVDYDTDRIVMLNERIRSITTREDKHAMKTGALIGGFGGAVLGLIVGALIATIDSDHVCNPGPNDENYPWGDCNPPREENDVAVILGSMGTGILVGSVTGAVIGTLTYTERAVLFYRDPKDPRRWEYLPR